MPRITVQPGQPLFDVALQHYGSLEGVFDIVRRNRLNGITENLYAGEELEALIAAAPEKDILQLQFDIVVSYKARIGAQDSIATIEDSIRGRGIGWWQLEREFSKIAVSPRIKDG